MNDGRQWLINQQHLTITNHHQPSSTIIYHHYNHHHNHQDKTTNHFPVPCPATGLPIRVILWDPLDSASWIMSLTIHHLMWASFTINPRNISAYGNLWAIGHHQLTINHHWAFQPSLSFYQPTIEVNQLPATYQPTINQQFDWKPTTNYQPTINQPDFGDLVT